jgi:hypothetical protein
MMNDCDDGEQQQQQQQQPKKVLYHTLYRYVVLFGSYSGSLKQQQQQQQEPSPVTASPVWTLLEDILGFGSSDSNSNNKTAGRSNGRKEKEKALCR